MTTVLHEHVAIGASVFDEENGFINDNIGAIVLNVNARLCRQAEGDSWLVLAT